MRPAPIRWGNVMVPLTAHRVMADDLMVASA